MVPSRKHRPIGGHDDTSSIAASHVLEHLSELQQQRKRQRIALLRAIERD